MECFKRTDTRHEVIDRKGRKRIGRVRPKLTSVQTPAGIGDEQENAGSQTNAKKTRR
jgi:hypothetical protein